MTEEPVELAGPLTPLWLTLLALGLSVFLLVLCVPLFGPVAALALSQLLAFGGVGFLGAVLPPALDPKALGLTPLARRFLLPIILLIPTVFLLSELDNWIRDWMALPAPTAEKLPEEALPETALDLLELSIYRVGLAPVVIEWFFRGVILERLRQHFGWTQAIIGSASLCAVATALPGDQAASYVSQLSFYFLLGLILGYMRFRAGSILPGILLSAGIQGVAALTTFFGEALIIPGFNTQGGHSSGWLIVPSLISVGVGLRLLRRFKEPDEVESS